MSEYRPGVCNIGPAEVARRRRAGHAAAAATLALAAVLVLARAPRPARLLLALPAAAAASGYIQARRRFCAGFGSRGIRNFGQLGAWEAVPDPADRAADLATSRRIGAASAAAGLALGALASLWPAPRVARRGAARAASAPRRRRPGAGDVRRARRRSGSTSGSRAAGAA
jgi:hypothetical protein